LPNAPANVSAGAGAEFVTFYNALATQKFKKNHFQEGDGFGHPLLFWEEGLAGEGTEEEHREHGEGGISCVYSP
jgi:hypothetical protein